MPEMTNSTNQLDTLLQGMETQGDNGVPQTGDTTTTTVTETNDSETAAASTTTEGSQVGNEDQSNSESQQTQEQQDTNPAKNAFAQMRVQNRELSNQNKQLSQVVEAIAKSMGIEGDLSTIVSKLSDDAITKQAEQQKVPVELLKRLQDLEGRDEQYRAASLKTSANDGFTKLRDEFGLSNEELITFADNLDKAGLNPYSVEGINIRNEFVARNLDLIVDRKVQAALKRDNAGENHSSNPGDKTGGVGETPKITTMQGLNSLLNSTNL